MMHTVQPGNNVDSVFMVIGEFDVVKCCKDCGNNDDTTKLDCFGFHLRCPKEAFVRQSVVLVFLTAM